MAVFAMCLRIKPSIRTMLARTITHVIGVRPDEQVLRVHTKGIVAAVQDAVAKRNFTDGEDVGYAMSTGKETSSVLMADIDFAVSRAIFAFSPWPTIIVRATNDI